MRAFRYKKYCAKGFFSKLIIMESIGHWKIPKKWEKLVFSLTSRNMKKLYNLDPHYFSILGGHTSSTFSNSHSFRRYALWGQNLLSIVLSFEKNPFAQYFLYLKALICHSKHYVLRFINQPYLLIEVSYQPW